MKVRAGFVSNSSSTSFLIIAGSDLSEADFFELMGIELDSPIAGLFARFYQDVIDSVETEVDFNKTEKRIPVDAWFNDDRLSPHMVKKLREAKERGLKAYYGKLDSESNPIQSFFCTDSFEVENEKIYFNGLENVW